MLYNSKYYESAEKGSFNQARGYCRKASELRFEGFFFSQPEHSKPKEQESKIHELTFPL